MATYLEICQSVLEEVNGRPSDLSTTNLGKDSNGDYYITDPTDRNVVRWVDDLYLQTQQRFVQADFMHSRGAFLTTQAGTETYIKRAVREIDFDSFYYTQSGSNGRIPVCVVDFAEWQRDERNGVSSGGAPEYLVRAPDEKWIIDPTPTSTFTLYGSWWAFPCRFDDPDDEPIWDAQFHDLLKWRAIALLATEFAQEAQYEVLIGRVRLMLPTLTREFSRRYLPSYKSANPLL